MAQAAELLSCSRTNIYRLIAKGELRAVDIGTESRSKTRVRADDVQKYIERHTKAATAVAS
jgi:excisionase family DNA binding protein